MAELKEILEALIFVHRGVLKTRVIEEVLKDAYEREEIGQALAELTEEYRREGGAFTLLEVAGGYEFGTRTDLAEWIEKMDHYEHHRHLSRPALETLAIIAYKQPVTRPEIEGIRGVNVDRIVRNLIDKKFIRVLGRKDVPGKPMVYGTTPEFLHQFGLRSLADLPSLKEFTDHSETSLQGEEEEDAEILPLEEGEGEEQGDGDSAVGAEDPEGGETPAGTVEEDGGDGEGDGPQDESTVEAASGSGDGDEEPPEERE